MEIDVFDPSGEGLGGSLHQLRRRATEDQKPGVGGWPIGQNSQHGEKVGASLNLIQHDEAGQAPQGQFGVCKAELVAGRLEVEVVARNGCCNRPGQGGFS